MSARILIVEDETNLAQALAHNLQFEGYETAVAADGEDGLHRAQTERWDLILLDVMMPKLDGIEVCRRIRAAGDRVPILFLTAKASDADRLLGLKVGADDYITKPFLLEELILRIRGILRRQEWYRTETGGDGVVEFGDNRVDFATWRATAGDRSVELSEKEAMLLKLLVERAGETVSREEILERVWGYRFPNASRTIDNFVVRLRRWFEPEPQRPLHLHSAGASGYRFTREAHRSGG